MRTHSFLPIFLLAQCYPYTHPQNFPVISIIQDEPEEPQKDFSYLSPKNITHYSIAGLLKAMAGARQCEDFKSGARTLEKRMEEEHIDAVFLGMGDRAYVLDGYRFTLQDFQKRVYGPYALHVSSQPFQLLIKDLAPEVKAEIESSVDYAFFTPFLPNCGMQSSTAIISGMSLGEGIIFLDTLKDGKIEPSSSLTAVISHEAEHEYDAALFLPTLDREIAAYSQELSVLQKQRENGVEGLDSIIEFTEQRIESGRYLQQEGFLGAFSSVYPWPTFSADQFMESKISEATLRYYSTSFSPKSEKDREFKDALDIAYFVTLKNKEPGVAEDLYGLLSSPDLEVNKKRNVYASLRFLYPQAFYGEMISLSGYAVPSLESLRSSSQTPARNTLPLYGDVLDGNSLYPLRSESLFFSQL
ncbi:MAG TPA: hypothetical protein HA370_00810 [Nanoarchaeota archaeon]|nr:hypothetical protein [Nanoarchaeota archaeon]